VFTGRGRCAGAAAIAAASAPVANRTRVTSDGSRAASASTRSRVVSAARALVDTDKDAETIVRRALDIAADICVYTNRNVTIETL